MALSNTDKKEIEVLIRKEIRDFMDSNTTKQFENKLIDTISKDIKKGKLEGDVKDIVIKVFREFYQFMWIQRGYWEPRLKNA
jgi:anti-sigma28 factor (negative regulator of flagellin synthesis)